MTKLIQAEDAVQMFNLAVASFLFSGGHVKGTYCLTHSFTANPPDLARANYGLLSKRYSKSAGIAIQVKKIPFKAEKMQNGEN